MRNKALIILSASVVGIGGLALIFGSQKNTESATAPEAAVEQTANEMTAVDGKVASDKTGSSPTAPDSRSSQAAPVVVSAAKAENAKEWKKYPHTQELQDFALIQQKALLLPADKVMKERLMKDERFLASLEPLLKIAPVDAESETMQNQALDFVFEALNSEMRSAAIEILKNVVADGSIENSSMDMTDRNVMAGVKAEALFNLASAEPSSKSDIETLLPGPVSKNIWSNVLQRQESNLAESATIAVSK